MNYELTAKNITKEWVFDNHDFFPYQSRTVHSFSCSSDP